MIHNNKIGRTIKTVTLSLLLVFSFSSCTKEPKGGSLELKEGEVRIAFSVEGTRSEAESRAVEVDPEAAIANIKVLFYNSGTKNLEFFKDINSSTQNTDEDIVWDGKYLIINSGITATQAYDIYVIANWTEGFSAIYFTVGTPITNLTDAFTSISGQIVARDATHHLLMSGSALNHTFSQKSTAVVSLVRQVAKINVSVSIDQELIEAYPDIIVGTSDAVFGGLLVYNIPNRSYVTGAREAASYNALMQKDGSNFLDYPSISIPKSTSTPTVSVYVYENITLGTGEQAKDKATFMVLQMPYKLDAASELVTANYYKFHIKNNADNTNPHQTVRNHIYNVRVNVVGLGEAVPDIGGITVTVDVLPWINVPTTDANGRYLAVDSVVMDASYEHYYIPVFGDFKGYDLSLDADLKDVLELTEANVNQKYITLRRSYVPHDGKIHFGKLTISRRDYPTFEVAISYDMTRVHVGGSQEVITGVGKKYVGGIYFMAGDVTYKDPVPPETEERFSISDPTSEFETETGWYFKYRSYWGAPTSPNNYDVMGREPRLLTADVAGEKIVSWSKFLPNNVADNTTLCSKLGFKNARYPTAADLELLEWDVNQEQGGNCAFYVEGRLAFRLNGMLNEFGTFEQDISAAYPVVDGETVKQWVLANSYESFELQDVTNIHEGHYVRCVQDNPVIPLQTQNKNSFNFKKK